MNQSWSEKRIVWVLAGSLAGAVVSVFWPQGPSAEAAYVAAGGDKFDMCAVSTIEGTPDGVFILDKATGRLLGAIPNRQTGGIGGQFARNLAADFQVTDGAEYLMVPAEVRPTQQGSVPPANGGVWVAEQKSGLAVLYLFPISAGGSELVPFARFQWRKAIR